MLCDTASVSSLLAYIITNQSYRVCYNALSELFIKIRNLSKLHATMKNWEKDTVVVVGSP
jgi:hypothetical protein